MITSINNIGFKANIKTSVPYNNKAAFDKISKQFEKMTSQYPNDALYITKTKNGSFSWHITDKKRGSYYKGEEIFTNSIDDHINELGVKKFTKELVNAFNAMKYERAIYKEAKPTKVELDKTIGLSNAHKNIARAYQEDGNEIMAKRYYCLSDRNKDKITKLKAKYDGYVEKFNAKINDLSKEFPEIKQVELYFI